MSATSYESTPHVMPLKVYLGVGSALLLLTLLTVGWQQRL